MLIISIAVKWSAVIKQVERRLAPMSVGSKASGSRSQSASDSTIINGSFSNAVHVYSLHRLERAAQWA